MPAELTMIVNDHRELTEAGRRGELGRLRSLLAGGADANARDQYGSTPLHSAASWGDRDIAFVLLEHGADPHARGWEGWTPLHVAAAMGNTAVIGLLLERGAEIDPRDDAGWTPLHLATRLGRVEEAAYLLSRGADRGARTADGQTPLDVVLNNERLRDRWEPFKRLLGEATRGSAASHARTSPGEIAADRFDGPEPTRPEGGRGRGR